MTNETSTSKQKKPFVRYGRWIFAMVFIVISIAAIVVYNNFNKYLSQALMKSFNNNVLSNVYELHFDHLSVQIVTGVINVHNVKFFPREKTFEEYLYINSTLKLSTNEIVLENVDIWQLLIKNTLKLDSVIILQPNVEMVISDKIPVFFPITTQNADNKNDSIDHRNAIEAFYLKNFNLKDADIKIVNDAKERELLVQGASITLKDFLLKQTNGINSISYKKINITIDKLTSNFNNKGIEHIDFENYLLNIEDLKVQKSIDTMIYSFNDLSFGADNINLNTADSIYHIHLQSLFLSYKNKEITIKEFAFKPNMSEQALLNLDPFQKAKFNVHLATLSIQGIEFDSLLYKNKLLVNNIDLDSVSATIFKDKTKPINMNNHPIYWGQTLKAIKMPFQVNSISATNVNVINKERKEDGTDAQLTIDNGSITVNHLTNLSHNDQLMITGDAYLEKKIHFNIKLGFDYQLPQFSLNGKVEPFNLTDLNQVLNAYTPVIIKSGVVDDLSFSGVCYQTNANGTMKFLYHDLSIDLEKLKDKASWKSSVISFGANAVVPKSNPIANDKPPRIVNYQVDRDMNKAFFNIILKSVFAGLKESILMSKDNRKAHTEALREAKE